MCVCVCVCVCVCERERVRVLEKEKKKEEKLEYQERLNSPNFLKLKMSNVIGPIQHNFFTNLIET